MTPHANVARVASPKNLVFVIEGCRFLTLKLSCKRINKSARGCGRHPKRDCQLQRHVRPLLGNAHFSRIPCNT